MKDRIYAYLRDAGGSAPIRDVLRTVAGVQRGAPGIEDSLAGWIAEDPRFQRRDTTLELAEGHEEPDRRHWADATFVVVDLETTGTSGDSGITEIGAVRVRGGNLVDQWSTLVDPGAPVPWQITRLTGIHDGMLEGQPAITEALPQFLEFLGDSVLVAHNAPFDTRYLRSARLRIEEKEIENPVLCTVRLSRALLPRLRSYGLDSLTRHLGIPVAGRHRALGDALATARLLLELLDRARARGWQTLGELAAPQKGRKSPKTGPRRPDSA